MRSISLNLFLGFLLSSTLSQAQGVIQIPLVVHVLYNDVEDSIPAELIETIILDSVNADFRRQNVDAIYTQTAYLPIAADTEIEFQFAQVDPNGNPTTGIVYKHTDEIIFDWYQNRGMMYDSLGGKNPWNECHYLNVWICSMNSLAEYANHWNGDSQGVIINNAVLSINPSIKMYRIATHYFGHFLGVPGFNPSSACVDTDGIEDTPIQSVFPNPTYWYDNPDTIVQEQNCLEIPEGLMAGNFMMPSWIGALNYMNMFTLGQKERMRNFISDHFPGFINPQVSCFTSVEENSDKLEFAIYPNPSTGSVTLSLGNTAIAQGATLSIFDNTGRLVFQENVENSTSMELNLQLSNGVYVVKLVSETLFHTEKLLIQ